MCMYLGAGVWAFVHASVLFEKLLILSIEYKDQLLTIAWTKQIWSLLLRCRVQFYESESFIGWM